MVDCARMSARPARVNVLAGPYIERAAQYRKDRDWLTAATNDPSSLFVPVWRARNLVLRSAGGLDAQLIERRDELFVALEPHLTNPTFLGIFRERACFALALDDAQAPPALGRRRIPGFAPCHRSAESR